MLFLNQSDSLLPNGLQQPRLSCPSPSPPKLAQIRVHWVSDAIQPSHTLSSPFPVFNLSKHQGFFPMNQLLASGGQRIGGSASASVHRMNTQDWFPLQLAGWITLQSKGLFFELCSIQKHQFFSAQPSLWSKSHIHTWILDKKHGFDNTYLFWQVMSLLFKMLSRFIIAFLPWSKWLLISWLQSPSAVILEPPKIRCVTISIVSPSICHEVMGPDANLSFLNVEFYCGYWYFSLKSWFQLVFHPAQHFTWCTVYKLNKQGDAIQPWHTPFPIMNQSVVPYLVLTVASLLACMFIRRQIGGLVFPSLLRIAHSCVPHSQRF